MQDIAELTPSRLLLLFNAWEHPGAFLPEIFLDVVVKGGSDAVVGLGFEVYVAESDRTPTTVEQDLAWAVSNDLIEVVVVDEGSNPVHSLAVNHLEGLLEKEGSDTWIPLRVRFWLTQQGHEFWRTATFSFPLMNMNVGKTRLIRVPKGNAHYQTSVGLLRWVPEHPGLMDRLRLRLWTTTPRNDLVWRKGETAPYVRVVNAGAQIMDGVHAWETSDSESTTFTRDESIEDSFTKEGEQMARIPLLEHWINDRKDVLASQRPGESKQPSTQP